MPEETLEDTIKQSAQSPKQASADGVNVQQQSLADQIAADKYLASKKARKNLADQLVRVKIIPPGTV